MRLDAPTQEFNLPTRVAGDPAEFQPVFPGMTQAARSALGDALDENHGLILIAGPPGSGKAATVDALLMSRPGALAIGEIGSLESAEAALHAARGRLVLATMGASDALGAIRRLTTLRVDPFPLACALRLVLAQRLVPRLCCSCWVPVQPPNAVTAPLGLEAGAVVHEARGCEACGYTGFAGSIGVFETMPVDATVGRLIVCGAEEAAIANHVFRRWPTLGAGARALVVQGCTTAGQAVQLLRAQRQ